MLISLFLMRNNILTNDVILAIDGKEVGNINGLIEAERNTKNCNGFQLSIWRNQSLKVIEVAFY